MPLSFTPKFVDMVRVTTSTTGTGPLVCGAAVSGFATFAESVSAGDSFYYSVQGVDKPAEREIGRGTYQANGTIVRQPLRGSLTNFTTGTKTIALVAASEWYTAIQEASSAARGTGQQLVATRAALAASPTGSGAACYLTESGREGTFVWNPAVPKAVHQADTAGGLYTAPSASADGAWERRFSGAVNVRWFGAVGDGVVNDGPAFIAAVALLKVMAVNNNGNTYKGSSKLLVPAGHYFMGTSTLDITHTLIIEGEGSGLAGGVSTKLRWATGTVGIRVQRYNTEGDHQISTTTHFAGDATTIRGLCLEGSWTSGPSNGAHAIDLFARAHVSDCQIAFWGGNGINLVATAGAGTGTEGNANCFVLERNRVIFCKNGVYIFGADVNAGTVIACDASSNRQWGFDDSSFLGNTFIGCHAQSNGAGPYRTTNANSQSVIEGCYSEGDQPPAVFEATTIVMGGQHGAGVTGGVYFSPGTSGFRVRTDTSFQVTSQSSNAAIQARAPNGYGTFLAGDGGKIAGQAGYLILASEGAGSTLRLQDGAGTIADANNGTLTFFANKGINLQGQTVKGFLTLSQAAYDALAIKDPDTFYFVTA